MVFEFPRNDTNKSFEQVIDSNKEEIQMHWQNNLRSVLNPETLEKIGDQEMTAQTDIIFKTLVSSFSEEQSSGARASDDFDMLHNISKYHAEAGISPLETLHFVLSLRDSLIIFIQQELSGTPWLMNSEIIKANKVTDQLCIAALDAFIKACESEELKPLKYTKLTIDYAKDTIPKIIQGLNILNEKTENETLTAISALQRIVKKSREGSKEADAVVSYFTGSKDESDFGISYVESVIRENEAAVANTKSVFHTLEQINSELAHNLQTVFGKVQEIEKFVAEISEIASQSKMLAINANIEAARAGEKGKRFSVVADEVRNLADTSARSAANINKIADESMSVITSLQSSINMQISGGAFEMELAEKKLTNAFKKFREFADNISDAIKVLTTRYRIIAKDIESTTVSLQFQDVVSQEITHINSALLCFDEQFELIRSLFQSTGETGWKPDDVKRLEMLLSEKSSAGYRPHVCDDDDDDVEFF
ncbi:MAG: hypothetical protein GY749_46205 [Desulfobacteraceae bacterium]|nr:hypothetical protein [Desulfobacteraceae bacterium]